MGFNLLFYLSYRIGLVKMRQRLSIDENCRSSNITKMIICLNTGDTKNDFMIPNEKYRTPLHHAAQKGNLKLVKFLLIKGAKIDSRDYMGMTPLHHATINGHISVVNYLLSKHANVHARDIYFTSLLHFSSFYGHKDLAEIFLDRGLNVNSRDFMFSTPLYLACCSGHLTVVVFLLSRDANVNSQNIFLLTPLHAAAVEGTDSFINYFINRYHDVVNSDIFERTTRNKLSIRYFKIASRLIEKNANVNAINMFKESALSLSIIENSSLRLPYLLVEKGADVNIVLSNRKTLFKKACELENFELIYLLMSKGTKENHFDNMSHYVIDHISITDFFKLSVCRLEVGRSVCALKIGSGSVFRHNDCCLICQDHKPAIKYQLQKCNCQPGPFMHLKCFSEIYMWYKKCPICKKHF